MTRARVLAALLPLLVSAAAPAAELVELEVTHEAGVYRLHAVLDLQAPAAGVYAVLTDVDALPRISSAIRASRLLPPDRDHAEARIHTSVRGCVLFFCRTLERVEYWRPEPPLAVTTELLPEGSDFRAGRSLWRITPLAAELTRVAFEMELEPDFWIPPVIGPALVRHRLARDGERAIRRIEALAQQR